MSSNCPIFLDDLQSNGLLPGWIATVKRLEDIPPKSILLVDESYLLYHSSQNLGAASRELSTILNLSRQRKQTIIFVSQQARQVDRNIASSADVVVFKDLGILQLEFDRRELSRIATQAMQAFESIEGDRKRWSYVYSPNAGFIGLMENLLPTFWSDRLSRAFTCCGEALTTKLPKGMTLEERIRKARELSQSGLSFSQIGKMLGVSKGTAYNYVRGYPYSKNAENPFPFRSNYVNMSD